MTAPKNSTEATAGRRSFLRGWVKGSALAHMLFCPPIAIVAVTSGFLVVAALNVLGAAIGTAIYLDARRWT